MDKRIFLLVIDGFGVGEAPDASKYGDEGSNTFKNLFIKTNMNIPNLKGLGLTQIDGLNLGKHDGVKGAYGRLQELSMGKDTTTGHFEMMDIITNKPMPTFADGFSTKMVKVMEDIFGNKILGNKVASGTRIIEELGQEHLKTKCPIVYTSADSVLQVATHLDIVNLNQLYEYCIKLRQAFPDIGRIIARPFLTNSNGNFERFNDGRKDFGLIPPLPNTMSRLKNNGNDVIAVGKIEDIFAGQDITKSYVNHNNQESLQVVQKLSSTNFNGLCFVNLVDTDMMYGHRNDVNGYAKCIEDIDLFLPQLLTNLKEQDYVIITADHGCDPTTSSTDHSREYVPLLIYSKSIDVPVNLGTLMGFNQIGKFIEYQFGINDQSKVDKIIKEKINER